MHADLELLYRKDEETWVKHFQMVKTHSETHNDRFAELMRKQQQELEQFLRSSVSMANQTKYKLKKLPLWGEDQGNAKEFEWPSEK